MEKKQFWKSIGIIVIILGVMLIAIGLIKNSISDKTPTTTTTTIPNPAGYNQYIIPTELMKALPEKTSKFTGGNTDTAIQTVTLGQGNVSLRYSIASKKYTSMTEGTEVLIVVTDTLGVNSLNGFYEDLSFLNTTRGYTAKKIIVNRPAWEIYSYGDEENMQGKGLLHVSVDKRIVVSLSGARGMSPETLQELASEVDYDYLES